MPGIGLSKCVFITGGTSGIGNALGYKIKELPNQPQVIMAGRRQERLDKLAKDGFETIRMDLSSDKAALQKEAEQLLAKYPDASHDSFSASSDPKLSHCLRVKLDTIILNAGIQREVHFAKGIDLGKIEEEMKVNYHSVFTLIAAFLPHLLKLGSQGRQTFLIAVSSGLAIFPAPQLAGYSASKAAVHSLMLALRAQLAETNVNVIEIIPPLVESELHDVEGTTEALSKIWMPLDEYIPITVDGLVSGNSNICAGRSEEAWNKFEKGKDEIASQMWKMVAGIQKQ